MLGWVLIVDSGSGGKFVYSKLKKAYPNENFILFIDKNYCPYGNKSYDILKKHVDNILHYFFCHFKIKTVVFACNTLSSMFKNYIKNRYKNVKLFFYEPILNKRILKRPTLVIATTNTIKYSEVIKKYRNFPNLFVFGFPSLAKMIDDNSPEIQPYLQKNLSGLKEKNIKNIVLGCTHYEAIRSNLRNVFGEVNFIEKTPVIIKKLSAILNSNQKCGKTLYFEDLKETKRKCNKG